jgi:hypothetical protein
MLKKSCLETSRFAMPAPFAFLPSARALRGKSGTLLLRLTWKFTGNGPARLHQNRSKTVPVLPDWACHSRKEERDEA